MRLFSLQTDPSSAAARPSTNCVHSFAGNPAGIGMRRRNSGGPQVAFDDVSGQYPAASWWNLRFQQFLDTFHT